jgi:NAD(P)-binding Rossmann-like domain
MNTHNEYDFIIIGGGIAGLYAAYRIKQKHNQPKILLLEKEHHMGGRAATHLFHHSPIAIGAGVGRKHKDHLLMKLLKDLRVSNHEFQTSTHFTNGLEESSHSLRKQFNYLRSMFRHPNIQRDFYGKPFSKFATHILGEKEYEGFKQCSGYTDFEQSDIHDVLYDYGFEDNTDSWTGVSLNWTTLVHSLINEIGYHHIHMSEPVLRILQKNNGYLIKTSKESYFTKKIVIASTIDTVKRLLPKKDSIYDDILGQPFLRIYGKFTKASARIMAQYVPGQTVVQGPIHKIIPMNPQEGIHMIVYSDNKDAKKLARYKENTAENREILCNYLEKALAIPPNSLTMIDMRDYYWKIGTHYYAPLDKSFSNRNEFIQKAQRPLPNVYVVGEMISRNQGWVEGALESVEQIFPSL